MEISTGGTNDGTQVLTCFQKLDIVAEARDSGNLYATIQKHDVQPNQIREWRKKEQKLIKKGGNGKASSVHSGPSVLNPTLENIVYTWILNQPTTGFSVSTADVVKKS